MTDPVKLQFRSRSPGVVIVTVPHTGGGVNHYVHDWCIISRVTLTDSKGSEKPWMTTAGVVLSYDESIQPGTNTFNVLAGNIFTNYKAAKEAVLKVWNNKQKEKQEDKD